MGAWLLNLPVVWMSVVILGGIYLFATMVYVSTAALAVRRKEGEVRSTDDAVVFVVGFTGIPVAVMVGVATELRAREGASFR